MENKIEKCCGRAIMGGGIKIDEELQLFDVVMYCLEEYNKNMYDIITNKRINMRNLSIDFSDEGLLPITFDSCYDFHQQDYLIYLKLILKNEDMESLKPYIEMQWKHPDNKRITIDFCPCNDNGNNLTYDIKICFAEYDDNYKKMESESHENALKKINAMVESIEKNTRFNKQTKLI